MDNLCIRCRGKGLCGKPCKILKRVSENLPKPKLHFSGTSPPEIFVGRNNYPNVFSGILSPTEKIDSENFSLPEQWVSNDFSIEQILDRRSKLVYARNEGNVKVPKAFNRIMQEVALASKPVSTEIFLKKFPRLEIKADKVFSIMANPAPVEKAILEENPRVEKKVDYLTSDYDVKAVDALIELYKSNIMVSSMNKIFSAGLLGVKAQRKMVPTRWSITAVDDTLGKNLLEKIRHYSELNEILLFHHYYNGNHFEVLFLPGSWSFEVIEVSMQGSNWNETINASGDVFMNDYEGFFPRKTYASHVVGAYYTDRLACCEYLEKIKKQATVLVFHEERPEYYAPLGVGIIRESLRKMFSSLPEKPISLEQALLTISGRLKASFQRYRNMSWILKQYGKQKKLGSFLS